jgi:HSP20 family protein
VSPLYFQRRELAGLTEARDLSAELRAFLEWLEAAAPDEPVPAEYRPQVDVSETPTAIEIVADLPGVTAEALRVVYTQGAVVIAGRKRAPGCEHRGATFHLAERTFGRFACVIRIGAAVDAGRAQASLSCGELRLRLPRIDDRRGRDITIKVETT